MSRIASILTFSKNIETIVVSTVCITKCKSIFFQTNDKVMYYVLTKLIYKYFYGNLRNGGENYNKE